MNNDIKYNICKYIDEPVDYQELQAITNSKDFLLQKIEQATKILNNKIINRPSLEELKNKNIIKNELVLNEFKREIDKFLVLKGTVILNRTYIAPSISNLVKKMNFEYKKVIIIHKLNIKRLK